MKPHEHTFPRAAAGSVSGVRMSYLVAITIGTATATVFFAFVDSLGPGIRVSIWDQSLACTLAYGFLLSGAASACWFPNSLARFALIGLGLTIAGATFGLVSTIGPSVGAGAALTLILVLWGMRTLLFRDAQPGRPTLTEAVTGAAVLTVAEGVLWIGATAPAYAEGFVLLSWALLGVVNALVLVALWLGLLLLQLPLNRGRISLLALTTVWSASIMISAAALYYMMWAEGAVDPPLEAADHWQTAFVPLGDPITAIPKPNERTWTKADVAGLLAEQSPRGPRLATLALLTGERAWAEAFKAQLLQQVEASAFTGPEHSMKIGQHGAMYAAFFFRALEPAFPGLISASETTAIRTWFGKILAGIFRTGWVDYLYAIPFRIHPNGPYLNQEVGAGAVAALFDVAQVEDPVVREQAKAYLNDQSIGWRRNFRNQDDTPTYQNLWMSSAFSLFRHADGSKLGAAPGLAPAVEWIKTQIPAAAFPLNYGYPAPERPLDVLALGAFVLRDGESKWLLDRQLDALTRRGEKLSGGASAFWLWDDSVQAVPPPAVSMLLYGPSGYTFRPGALVPDKVVFRAANGSAEGTHEL